MTTNTSNLLDSFYSNAQGGGVDVSVIGSGEIKAVPATPSAVADLVTSRFDGMVSIPENMNTVSVPDNFVSLSKPSDKTIPSNRRNNYD